MSLKRSIVRQLDNSLGRPLLAALATSRARRLLKRNDVEIRYDQLWIHRAGGYYIPDGIRFDYYDSTILAWEKQIPAYLRDAQDYWFGHYQPKPGDIVVDVGAGRGEDVFAFSREVGSRGRVLAVEAHPVSYQMLLRFCQMNKLENVTPVHAAIMDRRRAVKMHDGERWEANSVAVGDEPGASIEGVTLDALCKEQGITAVDFLKMNIEGAEAFALQGMKQIIGKVRSVCICCHDFRADRGHGTNFRTRDVVGRFLIDNGFEVSVRADDPRDYVRDHLYGRRVSRD